MKNLPWIALSSMLWAPQLQAQAAHPPAADMKASAPAAAQPAKPATPAAAAPAAKPAAAPATAASNDKSVEWNMDAAHSHIGFVARHLGFSKVSGQFKKVAAMIKADPKTAKITTLEATAETASIDTGIEKRDTHLKSNDFFNAEKYPQLKLVLKSIKYSGNKFTANCDLTIRDVTKSVPFKGELLGVHTANFGQGPQQRAGYEASATINRKDYGLSWNMVTEGLAVVGDNIQLELAIEMSYAAPATTAAAPATMTPAATTASTTPPTTGAVAHADKPATTPAAHPAAPAATAHAATPAPKPAAPATK
jgi:polyisoprenoid-binding protein YceI